LESSKPVRVLVIAGSDSSGGAGVDADRDALETLSVPADYVVTAWTKQSDDGVSDMGTVPADEWLGEARALIGTPPPVIKVGLLPGPAAVEALAALAPGRMSGIPVVFDPVLASSSGTRFHAVDAIAHIRETLLPAGLIWTPNLPELAELSGAALAELQESETTRVEAGVELLDRGALGVIIKGGHGATDTVEDLCLEPGQWAQVFRRPRLPGPGIRGSGCRFASAIAGHLALGAPLQEAARQAGTFVARRLSDLSD
jgi:hydroxymethylpyrimidine/phosphomethylpyrimidine kinase